MFLLEENLLATILPLEVLEELEELMPAILPPGEVWSRGAETEN